MTRSISDKAEVALEYPDKFYSGTFERSSRFEVSLDATGVAIVLDRPGTEDVRKSVHIHINYGLLADILQQMPCLGGQVARASAHALDAKPNISGRRASRNMALRELAVNLSESAATLLGQRQPVDRRK